MDNDIIFCPKCSNPLALKEYEGEVLCVCGTTWLVLRPQEFLDLQEMPPDPNP